MGLSWKVWVGNPPFAMKLQRMGHPPKDGDPSCPEAIGLTASMPACALYWFDRFGRWRRERWQAAQSEQEVVRAIEEIEVGIKGTTVGGGQEDGGVASVVDGDVGCEACPSPGFFDDV